MILTYYVGLEAREITYELTPQQEVQYLLDSYTSSSFPLKKRVRDLLFRLLDTRDLTPCGLFMRGFTNYQLEFNALYSHYLACGKTEQETATAVAFYYFDIETFLSHCATDTIKRYFRSQAYAHAGLAIINNCGTETVFDVRNSETVTVSSTPAHYEPTRTVTIDIGDAT